jgi:hypothetical protein
MGTVKLNNDVRTSVRGELGSSPRILLWTTQNRPTLPRFPGWGSDALDEGVTLGLRKRHSQNPLDVRLCDACDTCDASSTPLSALVFHHRQGVGRRFRSFFLLITRPSSKLPVTPVTRVTKPCAARVLGVTVPGTKRHSRQQSVTPSPQIGHSPGRQTDGAGSMDEPAPASLYSLQSLQLPSSYCHIATQPH